MLQRRWKKIIRDGSMAGRVIDSEKQTVANLRSERPFNMEWRLHSCAPVQCSLMFDV